jgi:hypothetical protein
MAALFGLDGIEVLAAADAAGELELMIETTAGPRALPGLWGGRHGEGPAPDLGRGCRSPGRRP